MQSGVFAQRIASIRSYRFQILHNVSVLGTHFCIGFVTISPLSSTENDDANYAKKSFDMDIVMPAFSLVMLCPSQKF